MSNVPSIQEQIGRIIEEECLKALQKVIESRGISLVDNIELWVLLRKKLEEPLREFIREGRKCGLYGADPDLYDE